MLIVLAIYAAVVWLLFFKLNILPWTGFYKTVVGIVGLVIVLVVVALLNSLTPSGRVTVVATVVEVSPVVSGTVTEVPVKANTVVEEGQVLLRLDKRPFEYALDLAKANLEIAEKTYDRKSKAISVNTATVSQQSVDESLAALKSASAQVQLAEYDLENTELLSPSAGEVTAIRVSVGDQVAAMSGVMPLIRTDSIMIAAVFNQNGTQEIIPGAEVGLTFDRYPGRIFWTTIKERTKGSAGGQIRYDSTLLSGSDLGSASEVLAVITWPDDLAVDALQPGAVGSATVISLYAGPMGILAKVLLWIRTYVAYL